MSTLNHFPSSQWSTIFTLAGFLQRGFNDGVPRWMMVANPRYRPGPQKSRCETYLSHCKNSHIMLAPIHQQQVAMTILSRGQPLSEYAQNCRRKISRQKLCRPRLANNIAFGSQNVWTLHTANCLITFIHLQVVNVYISLTTLIFIALLWPKFTSVQCERWVNLCWRARGWLGRGWLLCWGEMRERWLPCKLCATSQVG